MSECRAQLDDMLTLKFQLNMCYREAPVRGRTGRPKTPQDCPEVIADLISQVRAKLPLRPSWKHTQQEPHAADPCSRHAASVGPWARPP